MFVTSNAQFSYHDETKITFAIREHNELSQ